MRGDARDTGCFSVALNKLPDDLFTQTIAGDAVGAIHRPENVTLRQICGNGPRIDGYFDPGWHWRGADASMLTDQIDDAPAAVALLEVGERERGHFGSSQAAAQQHGEDGSVTQPAEGRSIWCAQQGLRLAK